MSISSCLCDLRIDGKLPLPSPVIQFVLDLALEGTGAGHRFLSELGPKPCPILIFTAQDESEMYGEKWDTLQQLGADDLVIKGMHVAESLTRKASLLLGLPMDDEDAIR